MLHLRGSIIHERRTVERARAKRRGSAGWIPAYMNLMFVAEQGLKSKVLCMYWNLLYVSFGRPGVTAALRTRKSALVLFFKC